MHAQRKSATVALLALPIEVLCEGLLPYMAVCDLQALDTAFTNKYLRPQLQQVWKSYQYDFLDVVLQDIEVRWLCGIGVKIVSVATETFPSALSYISTLKRLHIEYIVDDSFLLQLATNSPDLEALFVKYTRGSNTDDACSALAQNCRQLHTLHIRSESLTDADIKALSHHCRQLDTLRFDGTPITDAGIQALCDNCPHLKHIELSNCYNLTDASLMAIANSLIHLQSILLEEDNIFTDDGLLYFADKCHELRSVSVRCNKITSRGLTALWAANPNLMDVDISDNEFISDNNIIELVQCCSLLHKLNICWCRDITDAAVIAVAEHCPQLKSLNISSCYEVSDASLIALGQHCHELKSINISYLNNMSDVGIAALAAGCPLLQEFYADSTNITDAGVIALARGCRDLRKVTMTRCKFIGIAGVSAIAENCPLIFKLNFQSCMKVKDACLYVIAQHCRNLTFLEVDFTDVSAGAAVLSVMPFCRIVTKDANTMRDLRYIRSIIYMSLLFNGQTTAAKNEQL